MSDKHVELITQHYQDTYDLTYRLWVQRNRIFLVLLVIVALASLLTYSPETNSILLMCIGKALGTTDLSQLRHSIPFALLQGILLAMVFYLMVNLFHRSLYVLRNYDYLGELEREIRIKLDLAEYDRAFTRESKFYWDNRPWPLATVKYIYIIFLGALLLAFLGGRIYYDWGSGLLVIIDITITLPTIGYFIAYTWYSIGLDKRSVKKSS